MTKHKAHKKPAVPARPPEPPVTADLAGAGPPPVEGAVQPETPAPAGGALVEPPAQMIQRLSEELEQLKDQRLRLAAEFDNFKKRTQRERAETWSRAQAEIAASILDSLDDLGRVAHLDAEQTPASDVLAGVELVERKLARVLTSAGLERLGAEGDSFDPHAHEAVSTAPAPTAAQDHLVASVLQPGYRFGGALLRPARVSVYVWQEPPPVDAPAPGW
uniref:Protein GrpE n=1 Tax=uncultured Gemmatimonadetes bacterium Rifle_16ft_4_minimus_7 TaxID=1665098 RepID=A0A0H4TDL7_9BACT|nr:GrpE protein, molecular chaperone GrpE [uncultured Gemmatimonadetes bacterium Rifle_16ft_4_minimus_7]